MLLFLVFFVVSSVSANSFNYNQIGGKRKWVNTLIVTAFSVAPVVAMLSIQYGTYFATNHMAWMQCGQAGGNPPMYILWMFPLLLILPATTVMSRAIFKVSRNPYLAGIINAVVVALFACTNTMV